jgi:hypothetical protein
MLIHLMEAITNGSMYEFYTKHQNTSHIPPPQDHAHTLTISIIGQPCAAVGCVGHVARSLDQRLCLEAGVAVWPGPIRVDPRLSHLLQSIRMGVGQVVAVNMKLYAYMPTSQQPGIAGGRCHYYHML